MNILSYNIRGLGKGIKWASIRNLVGKHKIDLLCLQETKRDSVDKALFVMKNQLKEWEAHFVMQTLIL